MKNAFTNITSTDNPRYRQLGKLLASARERRKQGLAVLEGIHLLQAWAEAGRQAVFLAVRRGSMANTEIQALLQHFAACEGIVLENALFDAIAPVDTSTGIMAVIRPVAVEKKAQPQLAILLENIQDPGNLGSIIRTAAAAGCGAVHLSRGCAEAWSPKALRAGMGAQFLVPVLEQEDLPLVAASYEQVLATSLTASQSLYTIDLRPRSAFLFGNEGAGLSAELLACATHPVRIPMPGLVESLNVAAAVAICLFEQVRQVMG